MREAASHIDTFMVYLLLTTSTELLVLGTFGWAIIQSTQAGYQKIDPSSLDADKLDDTLDAEDKHLYIEMQNWLSSQDTIKWQFTEQLNNHRGVLQFHASSNHRSSLVWSLLDFIRTQSLGSYGAIYVHDDEDSGKRSSDDFTKSFRLWRILDGQLTEHNDPLFSPFESRNAFGGNL